MNDNTMGVQLSWSELRAIKCFILIPLLFSFTVGLSLPDQYTAQSHDVRNITDSFVTVARTPFEVLFNIVIYIFHLIVDVIGLPFFFIIGCFSLFVNAINISLLGIMNLSLYIVDSAIRYPLVFIKETIVTLFGFVISVSELPQWLDQDSDYFHELFHDFIENIVGFICERGQRAISFIVDSFLFLSLDLLLQNGFRNTLEFGIQLLHNILSGIVSFLYYELDTTLFILKQIISLPLNLILSCIIFVFHTVIYPVVFVLFWVYHLLILIASIAIAILGLAVILFSIGTMSLYVEWLVGRDVLRNKVRGLFNLYHNGNLGKSTIVEQAKTIKEYITDSDDSCVVCFEDNTPVKIFPCGHQSTCMDCLNVIIRMNCLCPLCRSPISGYQEQ